MAQTNDVKYEELSMRELMRMAKNRDGKALEVILKRTKNGRKGWISVLRRYYGQTDASAKSSMNDYLQESVLSVMKAIANWDDGKVNPDPSFTEASIYEYIYEYVKGDIKKVIATENGFKPYYMDNYVYLRKNCLDLWSSSDSELVSALLERNPRIRDPHALLDKIRNGVKREELYYREVVFGPATTAEDDFECELLDKIRRAMTEEEFFFFEAACLQKRTIKSIFLELGDDWDMMSVRKSVIHAEKIAFIVASKYKQDNYPVRKRSSYVTGNRVAIEDYA